MVDVAFVMWTYSMKILFDDFYEEASLCTVFVTETLWCIIIIIIIVFSSQIIASLLLCTENVLHTPYYTMQITIVTNYMVLVVHKIFDNNLFFFFSFEPWKLSVWTNFQMSKHANVLDRLRFQATLLRQAEGRFSELGRVKVSQLGELDMYNVNALSSLHYDLLTKLKCSVTFNSHRSNWSTKKDNNCKQPKRFIKQLNCVHNKLQMDSKA